MPDAITSQGFELEIGSGGPVVYTEVLGLTKFDGFDGQASEIDVTTLKSIAREFIMGLQDFGTYKLEANYLPDDAGQQLLRDAQGSGEAQPLKATTSDGTVATFQAYVLSSPISGGVDDKVSTSFTLRITGAVVFS